MLNSVDMAFDFLGGQSFEGLALLFCFTIFLEVPRYGFGFLALGLASAADERRSGSTGQTAPTLRASISVIVVGYNEAGSLERCLRSLQEQSLPPDEVIIVSDGSTDGMARLTGAFIRQGLAHKAISTNARGGKAAGFNLALGACRCEIVVNVDCDCSYDRFALENIVAPFRDPRVGAVAGEVAPRNAAVSLVSQFQEIEYLLSISVGRRVADILGQVSCVSGAFGAFRRSTLLGVGGCDVGGGEDFDLTLRLRATGVRIAFAPNATCYTDVPARLWVLIRQRLRWERDAIRMRLRKHRRGLTASGPQHSLQEVFHQWDFLVFDLGATVVFPFYMVWLFTRFGEMAFPVLLAMQSGLLLLDTAMLALAALVVTRELPLRVLLYLPGHSIFSSWVMRPVRLIAFAEEWFLFGSINDNYVPAKVRAIRKW